MWTCLKCNAVNEDLYPSCPKCGASRSAGRFSATGASRPEMHISEPIQAAPAQNDTSSDVHSPRPIPQTYAMPDLSKARDGFMVRLAGRVLMLLLPLIVVWYCIVQYSEMSSVLLRTFFKQPDSLSAWIAVPAYVFFTVCAALLAALPGLWTLAVGKILRRLSRMEALL